MQARSFAHLPAGLLAGKSRVMVRLCAVLIAGCTAACSPHTSDTPEAAYRQFLETAIRSPVAAYDRLSDASKQLFPRDTFDTWVPYNVPADPRALEIRRVLRQGRTAEVRVTFTPKAVAITPVIIGRTSDGKTISLMTGSGPTRARVYLVEEGGRWKVDLTREM